MTERITARQFHFSGGVEDWRVADGGACAYFPTGSFATGAELVRAVAEIPGLDDHAPDVDLRPDGVFVRLFTTAPAPDGLSGRDVELARRISSAARRLGLTAEPSEVQNVVVIIDALDIAKVLPFWRAVLGYGDRDDDPVEELSDRHRRSPWSASSRWMRHAPSATGSISTSGCHTTGPRRGSPPRSRPVAASSTTGWPRRGGTLADPEGNEVDVATWIGTDGLGFP